MQRLCSIPLGSIFLLGALLAQQARIVRQDEFANQTATQSATIFAWRHDRSHIRFETDVSVSALADAVLRATPDDATWHTLGCTEPAPQGPVQNDVTEFATGHDQQKQKQCYGYAAGDAAPKLLSGSLLGKDGVRRAECDRNKGEEFRKASKISVDEDAQAGKRQLFQHVVSAFHDIKVPVILSSGLLLGWWRECDFLTHDPDMDVNVLHRTLPDNWIQKLENAGLSVAVRIPPEQRFQDLTDNMALEVTLKLKPPLGGFSGEPYCDVSVAEEGQITDSRFSIMDALWPNGHTTGFWPCTNMFESLAFTRWNDVDVWVPYPPEAHLIGKYGETWNQHLETGWCVYCDCDNNSNIDRAPWQKLWELSDYEAFLKADAER